MSPGREPSPSADRGRSGRQRRLGRRTLQVAGLIACSSQLWACSLRPPRILAGYRSLVGASGLPRLAAHGGVDLAGPLGAPVLAAAAGEVARVVFDPSGCGLSVLLVHGAFLRYTVYCHLGAVLVREEERVERGQPIGRVGISGSADNVPHVHFELCTSPCPLGHRDGELRGTEDPLRRVVGCYRRGLRIPPGRLALTYPLACSR